MALGKVATLYPGPGSGGAFSRVSELMPGGYRAAAPTLDDPELLLVGRRRA